MTLELRSVAYWGPRKESVVQCARRFYRYMSAISQLGPHLAKWHEKAYTRKEALMRRIDLDRRTMRRLLDEGRNRNETDGSPIRSLGFLVEIWNGRSDARGLSLSIGCGLYAEDVCLNHVFLEEFFERSPRGWLTASTAVELVRASVAAWEPDWAGMSSRQAVEQVIDREEFDPAIPFVDWVVYHRRKRRRRLPEPARVAFEMHGGECIVVQETPVHPDNPEHCARARAVAKALGLPEHAHTG